MDKKCNNQNHFKMNVSVRFCAMCGKIVNQKISKKQCDHEEHMRNRKSGNHYCVHCGKDLKAM